MEDENTPPGDGERFFSQLLTDSNFCSAADARSDKMHEQAL